MKRKLFNCLMCLMLVIALGMPSQFGLATKVQAATSITLRLASKQLFVGDTFRCEAYGTTKNITWKSSKESVATVSETGLVKALKKGTAKITGSADGKSYTCTVTVINPYFSQSEATVTVGSDAYLTIYGTKIASLSSDKEKVATAFPTANEWDEDEYYDDDNDLTYYFSLSDVIEHEKTVSDKLRIHGLSVGTATITVKGTNGKKYKLNVTVTDPYVVTKEEIKTEYKYGDDAGNEEYTFEYKYDKQGNLIYYSDPGWNEGTHIYEYTYYPNGLRKTTTDTLYQDNKEVSRTVSEVLENGVETKYRQYENGKLTYEYTKTFNNEGTFVEQLNNYPLSPSESSSSRSYRIAVCDPAMDYLGIYGFDYDMYLECSDGIYYLVTNSRGLKETIQLTYDKYDRIIKAVAGSGNCYEITYTKSGDLASVRFTDYSEAAPVVYSNEFTYDDQNRLIGILAECGSDINERKYIYDNEGNRLMTFSKRQNAYTGTATEIKYDKEFREISHISTDTSADGTPTYRDETTYTYNTYNRITKMTEKYDYYGNNWNENSDLVIDYTYDKYGNVKSKKRTSTCEGEEPEVSLYEYTFDKNGNLTAAKSTLNDSPVRSYTAAYSGTVLLSDEMLEYDNGAVSSKTVNKYNNDGSVYYSLVNLNKGTSYESTGESSYVYDADGKLSDYTYRYHDNDSDSVREVKYTYDTHGYSYTQEYFNGEPNSYYDNDYFKLDDEGRLIERKIGDSTTTYTYDKASGLIKTEQYTDKYSYSDDEGYENSEKSYTYGLLSEIAK